MKPTALFLLTLLLPATALCQEAQVVATITGVERLVQVQRAGTITWENATLGTSLRPGDRIRTGKRSGVEFTFRDGSPARLAEAGLVVIDASRRVRLETSLLWGDFQAAGHIEAGDLQVDIQRGRFLIGEEEGADPRGRVQLFQGAATGRRGGAAFPLYPNPRAERFAGGTAQPFFHRFPTGLNSAGLPGSRLHEAARLNSDRILSDTLFRQDEQTLIGAQAEPETLILLDPLRPPDKPTLRAPSRAPQQQGYFAPRFDGNLIGGYKSNHGGFVGARLREYGVYGGHFWEAAVTPSSVFDGDWSLELSELNVTLHDERFGDVTIGRQRYLHGPVQNTVVGTLMRQGGRDVQDGVTWQPALTDPRLGVVASYLIDAFPASLPGGVSGRQTGWYLRGAYQTDTGILGLSATENILAPRVGMTADFTIPAIRNRLDVYGELGKDTFGRDVRTLGTYFPELYEKYDLDVFLEYTDAGDFGFTYSDEMLLRAYRPLGKTRYGVVAVDKRSGQTPTYGVGLVLQIGQ